MAIFWLLVATLGQAATLRLIDAGNSLHYQHLRTPARWTSGDAVWLTILAVQVVAVAIGLARRWPLIPTPKVLRPWQLITLLFLVSAVSATVSPSVPDYLTELAFAAAVQLIALGNLVLLAVALPEQPVLWFRRCFDDGSIRIPVLASIWTGGLAAALSYLSYQRHPHIADEVCYLYQARYFAQGLLHMPAPPVPEAFTLDLMAYEPARWYSCFPPGWPAVLALGVWTGLPWLVNPLLAVLNVLIGHNLLTRLYSRRTANFAVLLLATSPWHVFMSMNFMSHTLSLLCFLVAAWGIVRVSAGGSGLWAGAAGMALGSLALIRPLEGAAVGVVFGLRAFGVGGKRLALAALALLGAGTAASGSLTLAYNRAITGDPLHFPVMAYFEKYYGPKANALGFGPERGVGWALDPFPGHSPLDAAINANLNAFSVNIELLGWSCGSLVLAIALLLAGGGRNRQDLGMWLMIGVIFTAHVFYWFSGGPDFGARYWYLMLIPLVALTARSVEWLASHWGPRVPAVAALACLMTLVNYFPWRATDKYHGFLGMTPGIRELAAQHDFRNGLVLVRGKRFPDYASAIIYNPVDLRGRETIYAWDRSPEVRSRLLAAYPERKVWFVDGPSISGSGYRVVADR